MPIYVRHRELSYTRWHLLCCGTLIAGKGEKVAGQPCFMSVSSLVWSPVSWSLFRFFILQSLELVFLRLQLPVSLPNSVVSPLPPNKLCIPSKFTSWEDFTSWEVQASPSFWLTLPDASGLWPLRPTVLSVKAYCAVSSPRLLLWALCSC